MEHHFLAGIDERGRLKLPTKASEYFEVLPQADGDAALSEVEDSVLDFSVGEWRIWSIEELLRSFDEEQQ